MPEQKKLRHRGHVSHHGLCIIHNLYIKILLYLHFVLLFFVFGLDKNTFAPTLPTLGTDKPQKGWGVVSVKTLWMYPRNSRCLDQLCGEEISLIMYDNLSLVVTNIL